MITETLQLSIIFLMLAFCTSLTATGFFQATQEGYLLQFISAGIREKINTINKEEKEEHQKIISWHNKHMKEIQNRTDISPAAQSEAIDDAVKQVNIRIKNLQEVTIERRQKATFIYKPLFLCPTCMGSVWGLSGFLLFFPVQTNTQYLIAIPMMFAVAALNTSLQNINKEA